MIQNIFSVPVMVEELDLDLDSLTNYAMLLQEDSPTGIKRTNIGGWHSDIMKEETIPHEEMKKLMNKAIVCLNENKKELNIREDLNPSIEAVWINISRKGNINVHHVHPEAHFSAIFYVKIKTIMELGCLELYHPAKNEIDFCWMNILDSETTMGSKILLVPEENYLYILPSWIAHSVFPHKNDEPRITIAFNISWK